MKEYIKYFLDHNDMALYDYFESAFDVSQLETYEKADLFDFTLLFWILSEGPVSAQLPDWMKKMVFEMTNVSYGIALKKYGNDADFLCIYGYMLDVFPLLFLSHGGYEEIEKRGRSMVKRSAQMGHPAALVMENREQAGKRMREAAVKYLNKNFPSSLCGLEFKWIVSGV